MSFKTIKEYYKNNVFLCMLLSVFILSSNTISAQVSGIVYQDLPVNGTTLNTYGVKDGNEYGVEGVTVTVFGTGGATVVTDATGAWSVLGASGAVRIEFSNWPSYLEESPDGGSTNSSVQFSTGGTVNFGLHDPNKFSQLDPPMVTPVHVNGDVTAGGLNEALYRWSYNNNGIGPDDKTVIATKDQIGSTYGAAYSRSSKVLYLSTFLKRHVGLVDANSDGNGDLEAIYQVDLTTNAVSLWLDLESIGIDAGTVADDVTRGLLGTTIANTDASTFSQIGKLGFGDIDISADEKTLYVINLFDRKLYAIDIASKTEINSWAIPNSDCGNTDDARPFALKVWHNKIYVGSVCSGLSTQNINDVTAEIYEFDGVTFTNILSFPFDYVHGRAGNCGVTPWEPWTDTWIAPCTTWGRIQYTQPMFADIEFVCEGGKEKMVMSFMDRMGHQTGPTHPDLDGNGSYDSNVGGEILSALKMPDGSFQLENGGALPGGTASADQANNEGPGGGEFYWGETYDPLRLDGHQETVVGGMAVLSGSNDIAVNAFDPYFSGVRNENYDTGGTIFLNNTDGSKNKGFLLYRGASGGPADGTNGFWDKANGLGDLELLSDPAPIEIGNLVWEDTDGDGVQDADEPGISGVTVELYKSDGTTLLGTATTDGNGNYIFSNDPNGTTTGSFIFNIGMLMADQSYIVRFPTTFGGNNITTINSGEGTNTDLNDSDANLLTGDITVLATAIPITGANNHSFDVGYAPVSCTLTADCVVDQSPGCGQSDGEGHVTISGGQGTISYLWSSGETTTSITGKSAGTYTVTVTDDFEADCTATCSVELVEPNGPSCTASEGDAPGCGQSDGTAVASPTGGTTPYTYAWNTIPVQTTATATGLPTGTYTVTVTDGNGCTTTCDAVLTEPNGPSCTAAEGTAPGCGQSDGTAVASPSGGSTPYSYAWSTIPVQTTATATGLPAGTYTVTVTDANSCTTTCDATLTEPLGPSATCSVIGQPSCSVMTGGEASVTVTGGSTPYSYAWNTVPVQTTSTATGLIGGTYEVTVTDGNGCSDECSVVLDTPTGCLTHEKTISSVVHNSGHNFTVTYEIVVSNGGGVALVYGLDDSPSYDDDIAILSSSYTSDAPGNAGGALAGTGPWALATTQAIAANTDHTYSLIVVVEIDLEDGVVGDEEYTGCGEKPGSPDPQIGEGLFNESLLDIEDDGSVEQRDTACADLPYIIHDKSGPAIGVQQGDGSYDVTYTITVDNLGGAPGEYDLWDTPNFEDDIVINSGSYSSSTPPNESGVLSTANNTANVLGDDISIVGGATHTYTLVFNVSLDLSVGSTDGGDNVYESCGSGTAGTPEGGEGLYNKSSLDTNNDGTPEEEDEVCGDLPYMYHDKQGPEIGVEQGDGSYDVTYIITVDNIGGATGLYDLWDTPNFEDDIVINSGSYSSGTPPNQSGTLSTTNNTVNVLGDDISILAGDTHTYTLVFNVSLDLSAGSNDVGDNIYNGCGSGTPGTPVGGEGLYNKSSLDTNNDGVPEEEDEVCGDLSIITHSKTIVGEPVVQVDGSYNVVYEIIVENLGGVIEVYNLWDIPNFEDDIEINSANYSSDVPSSSVLVVNPVPSSGWILGSDVSLGIGMTHTYTLNVNVSMDLLTASSVGDEDYLSCGEKPGVSVSQTGEGLFNESYLDKNDDWVEEERDTACADLPFITHTKELTSITQGIDNNWTVEYTIRVENIGGASGDYDLTDYPGLEDDMDVQSVSVVSNASANGILPWSAPAGGWVLADDETLVEGSSHTYTITVDLLFELDSPTTSGDGIYDECGENTPGAPESGEGLFNASHLDTNNDGVPEEIEEVCDDLPYIVHEKRFVSASYINDYEFEVIYEVEVENIGGATGSYSLEDVPVMDNDITILSSSYTSDIPSSGSLTVPVPVGGWVLAIDESIDAGDVQIYTLTTRVQLDLIQTVGGDGVYDACGSGTGTGEIQEGEGLFNRSLLYRDSDSNPEEQDSVCGDIGIFDLALKKEKNDPTQTVSYNGYVQFDITVENQGTLTGSEIEIVDYIPCGYVFDENRLNNGDWNYNSTTGMARYSYSPTLLPGEQFVVSIDLQVVPCATDVATSWTNYSEISTATAVDDNGDVLPHEDIDSEPDSVNGNDAGGEPDGVTDNELAGDGTGPIGSGPASEDEDDHDPERVEVFDLALKKELTTPSPYTYGQLLNFEIEVCNQGNEDATNVEISDYIPVGYSYSSGDNAGWTGSVPTVVYPYGSLARGACATININLSVEKTTGVQKAYTNYAEITNATDSNGDPVEDIDSRPGSNNTEENAVLPGDPEDNDMDSTDKGGEEDDHDPAGIDIFDLALRKVKQDPNQSVSYGGYIPFDITVENQGSLTGRDIEIVDYIPCGYVFDENRGNNVNWVYDGATGMATYEHGVDLLPGEQFVVTIELQLVQCETDRATAWTNYSEISNDIAVNSRGEVVDIEDVDSEPDSVNGNDAGGEPDGVTDNELDGDGTGAIGSGPASEDEDDHDPERVSVFDLALKKELTTPSPYTYGQLLNFEIEVCNQGNEDATNVEISDYIPVGYSYSSGDNAGWTGSAPTVVYPYGDLAIGACATIGINLRLQEILGSYKGWINYAEITNATDSNGDAVEDIDSTPGSNNTEENAVLPGDPLDNDMDSTDKGGEEDDHDPAGIDIFDLALRKLEVNPGVVRYGTEVLFSIEIFNQGSLDAKDVEVVDYIPCGYSFDGNNNLNWSYDSNTRKAVMTYDGTISPGESAILTIELEVIPCSTNLSSAWTNYAEISLATPIDKNGDRVDILDIDSTPDATNGNDAGGEPDGVTDNVITGGGTGSVGTGSAGGDEDDHDPALLGVFDLALDKKVDDRGPYMIGEDATFRITVYNQGNVETDEIYVKDHLRTGFRFNTADNTNWTLTGNVLEYTVTDNLSPGESYEIVLVLEVVVDNDPSVDDWYNYAEIAGAKDTNGNIRNDDVDSRPDSNSPYENEVLPDGRYDNEINEHGEFGYNGPGDEDDHDPEKVIVVGALGDKVWKDIDGDGIQDPNEPGIAGVEVCLYQCTGTNADYSNSLECQTTDGNGNYFFENLIPGDYTVVFNIANLPEGCDFTFSNQGGDDSLDSDTDREGKVPCIHIEGGVRDSTVDAGLLILAEIGNFVWHDLDGDGLQENSEPGIPGVEVKLFDGTGTQVGTTTTNAAGYYIFENLYPGDYYIMFGDVAGYDLTFANQGTDERKDSDVDGTNGVGTTVVTHLSPGESDMTWDAGFYKCIPIGELVWYDTNENDIWDEIENGINGLRVNLYRLHNDEWILWEWQYTGHKPNTPSDDGYYKFCAPPGTYHLGFELPEYGLVPARPNIGDNENVDSDVDGSNGYQTTGRFTVYSGEEKLDIGAGYYPMASVGDRVWDDENADGRRNTTENFVEGVKVEAYNIYNEKVGEDYTDTNGEYMIDYLQKSTYYLKFELPSGYGVTEANMGGNESMDSDVDHSNGFNTTDYYQMQPGVHRPHVDAGIVYGITLPIELMSFTGHYQANFTTLNWITGSELNSSHFVIERRYELESTFVEIGEQVAQGNSTKELSYRYEDYNIVDGGIYYYRLRQVDKDGSYEYSEVISVSANKEIGSSEQVLIYPNPTIGYVNIELSLSESAQVELRLLDVAGRVIRDGMLLGELEGGVHKQVLDVSSLQSGVYSVEIQINNKKLIRKLIVMEE